MRIAEKSNVQGVFPGYHGISKQIDYRNRPRHSRTCVDKIKANAAGVDNMDKRHRESLRGLGKPQNRFVCPTI